MRIIAGVARGRTLGTVAGATRPTSDRAREALFSTLASEFGDFAGLNILDLYAGTGAIALESLSRGAGIVHAVEKDEQAQKSIAANFESIKTAQCPGSFHLFGMSVHRFLQDRATVPYHFIYIDPPYDVEDIDVIENPTMGAEKIQSEEGDFDNSYIYFCLAPPEQAQCPTTPSGHLSAPWQSNRLKVEETVLVTAHP